ncbi:TPA: hypothetical protein U2C50_000426 [Streptococcus suis]|uniref:Uncharacterized protein n=2 Tax=Streptococcus TaxID=1301 RepID=A0A2X3UAQ3_STRTR|nr:MULTISPECIES: hypothetical protein [Streptococcus]AML46721.1 hypothetical protein APQ97_06525 [Streptococcus suis]KPA55174.1 hypothetical protein XK23_10205 [Streptococcus suis]MBS8054922.1 hypothetical protein [Streptococcus suis]MBY5027622.1 hypothetical protein [Streptococcus suis]MCB2962786.1 hypothetical protein [Streptococcus suis]
MATAIYVFRVVQIVVGVTGLVWVLSGALDFFGGRNNNDSMRQEKGSNGMVNGGAIGLIGTSVCQAIIALLGTIS